MAIGDKDPVVMQSDRAVPSGIATLGTDGKLLAAQIPGLAKLGAAPAGYGLGGNSRQITASENIDKITANGWYWWSDGVPKTPFYVGSMLVINRGEGPSAYCHQIAFFDGDFNLRCCVRKKTQGTWGDWEWLNPSMTPGTEYRTTERHNGKTVYTTLVDCGTMPNTGIKSVGVPQIPATAMIVASDVFCYRSSVGEDGRPVELAYKLPIINTFSIALYQWWNTFSNTFQCLAFDSDRDMSGFKGYAIVKYTKD